MAEFTDRFDSVTEETSAQQPQEASYSPSLSYIGDMRVDLVKAMSPNNRWELSRHVIDNSSDFADHRVKLPVDLVLSVLITDDQPGTDDDDPASRITTTPRTWQDKIAELEEAMEIDQVYEVVTPKKVYPSLMVVGYAPEPSVDISNGEQISISFSSVKLSTVKTRRINPSMVPKKRKKIQPPEESPEEELATWKGEIVEDTGTVTPEAPPSWASQLGLDPTNLWR